MSCFRSALLQTKFSTTLNSFRNEVDKLGRLSGHPGIARLYGSCIDEKHPDRVLIVTNELTPWFRYLEMNLPWCVRVHTSITLMSLLDYLQHNWTTTSPSPAWIHCDLNRAQFAMSSQFEAVLVDYGGLEERSSWPFES